MHRDVARCLRVSFPYVRAFHIPSPEKATGVLELQQDLSAILSPLPVEAWSALDDERFQEAKTAAAHDAHSASASAVNCYNTSSWHSESDPARSFSFAVLRRHLRYISNSRDSPPISILRVVDSQARHALRKDGLVQKWSVASDA